MTGDESSRIRTQALERRRSLDPKERAQLNAEIASRWSAALTQISKSTLHIGIYRALPDEVALLEVEAELRSLGARMHFPRIQSSKDSLMEFVEVGPGTTVWEKGPYGIDQPHTAAQTVDPSKLDLVFLPGTAFGESGERIGMGKGYFDRYLPRAANAVRVALAYDFQLFKSLPQQPWDQRVHWILTEKREIKLPFAESWLSQ